MHVSQEFEGTNKDVDTCVGEYANRAKLLY